VTGGATLLFLISRIQQGDSLSDSSRCEANFKPNKVTDLRFDTVGL
jgi:hypothetical protein